MPVRLIDMPGAQLFKQLGPRQFLVSVQVPEPLDGTNIEPYGFDEPHQQIAYDKKHCYARTYLAHDERKRQDGPADKARQHLKKSVSPAPLFYIRYFYLFHTAFSSRGER